MVDTSAIFSQHSFVRFASTLFLTLNRGHFYLSNQSLKFDGDLLGGWKLSTNAKFHHNISKITPASPEKLRDMGCFEDPKSGVNLYTRLTCT